MSRLKEKLEKPGKFIPFIVAGDPTFEKSYDIACEIIESGADVLELGLPFSDPVADGPTIQAAGKRAIDSGMNTDRYFELVGKINKKYETPIVCLTYYNMVLQYGLEKFSRLCKQKGVDGLIIPDLPIEESKELMRYLDEYEVDFIFLVAETTTKKRLKKILKNASGYIYIVSLLGTTGVRNELSKNLKGMIKRIRTETTLPLAVGFGIKKPEDAKKILNYGADAVIVGSAIVQMVEKGKTSEIKKYVKNMKKTCLNHKND